MKRIKVLFVTDDIRIPSGVGIQAYKLVKGLQKTGEYDIVCMGGSFIPGQPQQIMFEGIKIYPVSNGYGDAGSLKMVMQAEKPDITVFFSDPRFFQFAFTIDNELRPYTKYVFYHTWDNAPFPHYNKTWYSACDHIVMLSNFSYNLMKSGGLDVEFIPHGGDPSEFYRLDDDEINDIKKSLFKNLPYEPEFVFFFNNKNIIRKRPSDVIVAFRRFWEKHPKTALLMNTRAIELDGNDLKSVIRGVEVNNAPIIINETKIRSTELNKFYNISDATINIAIAEGFGLSCMESLLAETPGITVKTGGLTEQMTDGTDTFGILMEPDVKTLFGLVGTPYSFQDFVSLESLESAMEKAYNMKKEGTWKELGEKGRKHIIKNYHINNTVQKWDELLKKVAQTPTKFEQYTLHTF